MKKAVDPVEVEIFNDKANEEERDVGLPCGQLSGCAEAESAHDRIECPHHREFEKVVKEKELLHAVPLEGPCIFLVALDLVLLQGWDKVGNKVRDIGDKVDNFVQHEGENGNELEEIVVIDGVGPVRLKQ